MCIDQCRAFGCVCFLLWPQSRDICTPTKGQRAQAERARANRHPRRPWPMHSLKVAKTSWATWAPLSSLAVVQGYVEQGIAEVVHGVEFIDEVHMLDIECFTCLDVLLESPMVQTLVLVTNCGQVLVRGMVDIILPHGIAVDLDRYLLYFDFVTVVDAT